MKFTIYQDSRVGKRTTNQDRLLYRYSQDALLMVVADGMGGHSHGDIAAQLATVRIAKFFDNAAVPRIRDPQQFLREAMLDAHRAVQMLSSGQPRPPHTTCVVCLIQDGRAWWAHAGDSRLYLLRKGQLLVRTRDHSYVEALLQRGLIKASEMQRHPDRHLVLSCLGAESEPKIDIEAARELNAGDVILLCTDGLWEALREQTLVDAMARGDVMKVAPQLMNLAETNAGDNGDNLTLIAARWDGGNEGPSTIIDHNPTITCGTDDHQSASLSDEEIESAIMDIRNRLNPDKRNN
jgi:serine/threonine protein phosphatase PrpC